MRSLAHIEKIVSINPIPGADNIESAYVLGWQLIIKKGEFKVGDLCVYIEIDSIVPNDDERFKFLESKNYRIKTMKLNKFNIISQGLALPVTLFPEASFAKEGDDVTDLLHIKKAEIPEPCSSFQCTPTGRGKLGKGKKNAFPSWIHKTDETRCENIPWILKDKQRFIATEKIDGTSTTFGVRRHKRFFFFNHYEFVVCSRNLLLDPVKDADSVYYQIYKRYNIKQALTTLIKCNKKARTIVIQGETFGEGLQGNPYKLKGIDFKAFNYVVDGVRINLLDAKPLLSEFGIHWVPILNDNVTMPDTMEELKAQATGKSTLAVPGDAKILREGIVYRSYYSNIEDSNVSSTSFKNVSKEYLLKHEAK